MTERCFSDRYPTIILRVNPQVYPLLTLTLGELTILHDFQYDDLRVARGKVLIFTFQVGSSIFGKVTCLYCSKDVAMFKGHCKVDYMKKQS